ncbi:Serine/threonine protein kinase [Thermostaphylospora chromogena]|uniref:non-specific serine/threonine protein kinase n=1 Tax=Thermostaphylospora chromogena TaxID=35622 RepID=A0A1H1GC32_9ACTN|nr:Serine/threonine protein kinase [Thermostaphylospora chromogena]
MKSEGQRGGRVVAGRYHLISPIGRGGMGVVWSAHDDLLDRTVAVKEVRYASVLGDEVQELNRRTMREARAAARLTHPNVVVVHDVIEEDGRPWIVMQLVQSRSLGQVIREDGPLRPREAAKIGLAVVDALRSAHRAGVLHRDVKPENVLLADDGRVVLTDFGIATLEAETSLTVTGLAGTPAFIAPERLQGRPARRESDLWSLGATLYAALEGRPPHDRGTAMATMHSVLNEPPDPAPHAGPMLPVIEGLLAKEPVQRLTHDEAAEMMERVIEGDAPTRIWPSVIPAARPAASRQEPAPRRPVRPAQQERPLGASARREAVEYGAVREQAMPVGPPQTGYQAPAPKPPPKPSPGRRPEPAPALRRPPYPSQGQRPSPARTPAERAEARPPALSAGGAASGGEESEASGKAAVRGSREAVETGAARTPREPVSKAREHEADLEDAAEATEATRLLPLPKALPLKPSGASSAPSAGPPEGDAAGGRDLAAPAPSSRAEEMPTATLKVTPGRIASGGKGAFAGKDTPATGGKGAFADRVKSDGAPPKGAFAERAGADAAPSKGAFAGKPWTGLKPRAASPPGEDAAVRPPDPSAPAAPDEPGGREDFADDRPAAKEPAPDERADGGPRPDRTGEARPAQEEPEEAERASPGSTEADGSRAPEESATSAPEPSAAPTSTADDADDAGSSKPSGAPGSAEASAAAPATALIPAAEPAAEGSSASGPPAASADAARARDDGPGTALMTPAAAERSGDPVAELLARVRPMVERARPALRRMRDRSGPLLRRALALLRAAAVRVGRAAGRAARTLLRTARTGGTRLRETVQTAPARKVIPAVVVATLIVAVLAAWLGMRSASQVAPPPAPGTTATPSGKGGKDGGKGRGARDEKSVEGSSGDTMPVSDAARKRGRDGGAADRNGGAVTLPSGWRMHRDAMGFSIGLPKGWKPYKRARLSVWFRGPGSARGSYLLVQEAEQPRPDPLADWRAQEKVARHNFTGYKRIRIAKADYMKAAADWEFTWRTSSGRARVLNRGFLTHNGRGYALYWHTRADSWKKDLPYFQGFAATFTPAKKKG